MVRLEVYKIFMYNDIQRREVEIYTMVHNPLLINIFIWYFSLLNCQFVIYLTMYK